MNTSSKGIEQLEAFVKNVSGMQIKSLIQDDECAEYYGLNFYLGTHSIKFRKTKITPKKVGQFVSLWKRNKAKKTEPYNENDPFDFYIFESMENEKIGFFFFPKSVLIANHILSTNQREGKRGFRLYPDWVKTENKQAQKTQAWQIKYFIPLGNSKAENKIKMDSLLADTMSK